MAKNYNVFISHSWDHLDDLYSLRQHLQERGYFNVDFSEVTPENAIKSENIYYVHARVAQRIANADIVIGLAGVYASHSDWMTWELDKAIELSKPILGVIPRGQERISTVVSNRADKMVRWNTESIVAAIRELA